MVFCMAKSECTSGPNFSLKKMRRAPWGAHHIVLKKKFLQFETNATRKVQNFQRRGAPSPDGCFVGIPLGVGSHPPSCFVPDLPALVHKRQHGLRVHPTENTTRELPIPSHLLASATMYASHMDVSPMKSRFDCQNGRTLRRCASHVFQNRETFFSKNAM